MFYLEPLRDVGCTAEVRPNAHMVPSRHLSKMEDMVNNIMNRSRARVLHPQEPIHKHRHDDTAVALDTSEDIIGHVA